ncbi:MAG TPA: phosphoribosylamine--glycine ligase [Candidatus Marinimicrobia bacterium]|nr:phosphoribosylamine--glycine ligase [Candidatus Neomarinimicrobiota bacterium]HRS51974.1 phosphoribosylamine--glycine ligase [Candidatus Neomarinimicrobiota bacterium]HRU91897.1 phosphoribosylamine--glycine ligase [Candidatus Neomarinimicrobiota bacterium]
MKVLIVGSGGREHALVWKLSKSPNIAKIYCAPGNAGTDLLAENIPLKDNDLDGLLKFALENSIDLTVVGPEIPLVNGIVDKFRAEGLKIFGPTAAAAQLEGSKVFAKQFMSHHQIPTAAYQICDSRTALESATRFKTFPYVIKVDGLAAGKGALIIHNDDDLKDAFVTIWDEKRFGPAGNKVVVEDFLPGEELSVFVITDGERYLILPPAQDHKRIGDNDTGPNTGGMGAYAPAPLGTPQVMHNIEKQIIIPTLNGLRAEGIPYTGVLYCGLMIDGTQPYVVEFNARFGDPETQVVLPLIESDLGLILLTAVEGKLDASMLKLSHKAAVCVVMASAGYPGNYEKGKVIYGLQDENSEPDTIVFQAGTIRSNTHFLTNGGRVLAVTALADNLEEAITKAYKRVAEITFDGAYYRHDIGQKGLRRSNSSIKT